MSESGPITQISGNTNQGYIAGRDLYLGDQYVAQETLFFEPDLSNVEPPAWTTTPKAEELARALARDRLIVLAGQGLDEKTMVARHLAWLLRQELPGEVRVREWYRSSDPQKIETAFHETATTILLLPQVQPHHIGHRLSELGRLLHTRRNFTIITTEGVKADWGIRSGAPEETFWHELSWETYYGRAFLAENLAARLRAQAGRLPEWVPKEPEADTLLCEGLTVKEAAARLKQPDRIERFVEWLSLEGPHARSLLAQLEQLAGDSSAIFRWYGELQPADQLFVLGLVLFDGLPDDQIFAAVELLVAEAWRRTDPNLPLFDYRDLNRVGAYIHLTEAGEDGARIETTSGGKRDAILRAAWEFQRRRLLAVVPAMTRLIKSFSPLKPISQEEANGLEGSDSSWRRQLEQVGPSSEKAQKKKDRKKAEKTKEDEPEDRDSWRFTQGPERELFSSPRRAQQLQQTVIESLSQIGLLSFHAVEASFLELAVEGSVEVQTVVAKALAAWRGKSEHEKLFKVLGDWWEAGARTTLPKALSQKNIQSADPLAAIRATVVQAIGYAVQYDPPNQLSPVLLGLLNVAVMDMQPAVRQRVLEVTLPLAAASHPVQLEELFRQRLSQDQEQMFAIAFGIAMAFSLHPEDALSVIERWHIIVRSHGPREPGDLSITPRDRLLSAVALAYGYLRCERDDALVTPARIVSALKSILESEGHPFVRRHTLMAMGLQALNHFEVVAPSLMEQVSEIALPDRINAVSVFVRAYLKQREQLTDGDGEIEIGEKTYQVWSRTPRPLTPIEESLYQWLRDEDNAVARQIAAQTFTAFAATPLEQRERNLSIGPSSGPEPAAPVLHGTASRPRTLRHLPLAGHLAVFFSAPWDRSVQRKLRPVMAEVIDLEQRPGRDRIELSPGTTVPPPAGLIRSVLNRWSRNEDEAVQRLARSTSRALHFFHWRWAIAAYLVLGAVLYGDWRDWKWSHLEPLPVHEAMRLQERRSTPLRLERNLTLAELRRKAEERARKEAEAARREAERMARRTEEAVVEDEAEVEEAPEPPVVLALTPVERLRWSAALMSARLNTAGILEDPDWLLFMAATLQQQALERAKPATGAKPDQVPPRKPPSPAAIVMRTPSPVREAAPEVEPESRPASQASSTRSRIAEPEVLRETETPVRFSDPAQELPKWKKLLGIGRRKKPPTGENNGNG